MNEIVLSVRGLEYAYDDRRHALDGISLDIRAGEKIAVLGTNGAGKSTFFLCLNGVYEPHAGQICLHGQVIDKQSRSALREHVGVVFQNADDQIIASTVEAEISFGPMNLRLARGEVERRVNDAIRVMELEPFRSRPPHYMSGGEKKRVSIADILAMESEIILFDEPAASLDPAGAEMLEQVLESLSRAGKTLLISTHDMDFAFRWAERVLVFCEGRIIDDGSPQQVFSHADTIACANLRRPTMLEVYERLRRHGLAAPDAPCPRTPQELENSLQSGRLDED